MNGETGYGIVEFIVTGGSKRYGIPRAEIGGKTFRRGWRPGVPQGCVGGQ